jgi:hypothetical protein
MKDRQQTNPSANLSSNVNKTIHQRGNKKKDSTNRGAQ